MTPRAQISVPTIGVLPHNHRLPSTNPEVSRAISKLSRQSLISLALRWLDKKNRSFCEPYLYANYDPNNADNDEAPYDPAQSHEELQEIYRELQDRKGNRKEVVERILDGDWRHGISLYQIAMAETQCLLDHPTSLRWSAQRLVKKEGSAVKGKNLDIGNSANHLPRFQAQTFLLNLVREVSPVAKAHYYLTRIKAMPITLLRVYIHDSPYITEKSLQDTQSNQGSSDGSKSLFLVIPDGSPFIYVSIATGLGHAVGLEGRSLRNIVLDAVPKALSKPSSRYELQPTSLAARSLSALLTFRGPGRSNSAAGGWSIFSENSFNWNTLDFAVGPRPSQPTSQYYPVEDADKENAAPSESRARPKRSLKASNATDSPATKRRKQVAEGRFGQSGIEDDGKAIERVEIRIDDPFPSISTIGGLATERTLHDRNSNVAAQGPSTSKRGRKSRNSLLDRPDDEGARDEDPGEWRPDVRLSFQGTHVFAGIRQLVEQGVIDGEKMHGWMTGEAGVSIGVVRHGKIMMKRECLI
ncbi:CHL4-domain-containing protein [Lepidopterella palustris CBS 459.81]|uniref:CHL4-domain-containing protein n=1 Tax=Lepidopterella palustris CBS 459.81 TaxID=1314670 RepID=A0A8E2JGK6_9PEZI|nr:CHL4-domain-containing protein [Lepidopterella palustris CBS 459.81]